MAALSLASKVITQAATIRKPGKNNMKTFLVDSGLSTPIAGFLAGAGRFAGSVAAAGVTAWLLVKVHLAPRAMVKEHFSSTISTEYCQLE